LDVYSDPTKEKNAPVVELVDALDSKSCVRKDVSVRVRPGAPPNSSKQIDSLTGLRGYVVLAVLFYHIIALKGHHLDFGYDMGIGRYVSEPFHTIASFGYYGVDVFFILSGFVIAYTYAAYLKGHLLTRRFLVYLSLRIARLYPAHLAAITALIVMAATGIWNSPLADIKALPYHLTFTYAWWLYPEQYGETWNLPSWSISAEFFSYICFPFLIIVFSNPKTTIRQYIGIAVCLCFWAYLIGTPISGMKVSLRAFVNFSLGYIAHRIYLQMPRHDSGALWAFGGIGLLLLISALTGDIVVLITSFCIFATVLGLACMNPYARSSKLASLIFENRLIVYTGLISYSIYIIQFPCFVFLNWLIATHFSSLIDTVQTDQVTLALCIGLVVAFIFACASGLYFLIEKPILAYCKRKIYK
jgi:peptidoglycan/LPS O-acetylase OafA/YrhL